MKITKTQWLIWLQFVILFLFFLSEVNAKRPCGRLLRNIKLSAHTKIAPKQHKANHVTLVCDKGYYFSKGKNTRDLSCKILKKLSNDRIPRCKGCGEPQGLINGRVKFLADSVGSVAVYSCDVGFSLTGSRKQRKCRSSLRWSAGKSRISCQKDYSECGTSPFKTFDDRARIVGGKKANERHWPWAVRVLVGDHPSCGGTLINQQFVLTAASCFDVRNTRSNDVKILFQDGKRTVRTCRALYIHPYYNPINFRNDIALIKIPKLKRFTRNQQAICLPRGVNITDIMKHGNNMYIVGWGSTAPIKPRKFSIAKLSKNLKQVKLPLIENKFCADNVKNKTAQGIQNWYFNSTTQFCAGDVNGQKDACQGDSGGPAMVLHVNPASGKWRWFQVGVISWGNGCAQKGEVGYYTKVSAYVDWIEQVLKS